MTCKLDKCRPNRRFPRASAGLIVCLMLVFVCPPFLPLARGQEESTKKPPARAAAEKNPKRDAMIRKAAGLQAAGRRKEACAVYEKWIDQNTDDVQSMNALAMLYLEMGRTEEANAMLAIAVVIDPYYYLTRVNLAALYYSVNEFERSLEQAKAAVKYAPEEAEAHYAFGLASAVNGSTDEALDAYAKAISMNPRESRYHQAKCELLTYLNLWEESEQSCRTCVKLEPRNALAHFFLSMAQAKMNLFEEALASARKAAALQPKNERYARRVEMLAERVTTSTDGG